MNKVEDSRIVVLPVGLGVMQSVLVDGGRIYLENGREINRKRAENNVKLCLLPVQVDAMMVVIGPDVAEEKAAEIRAVLGD